MFFDHHADTDKFHSFECFTVDIFIFIFDCGGVWDAITRDDRQTAPWVLGGFEKDGEGDGQLFWVFWEVFEEELIQCSLEIVFTIGFDPS